MASKFMPNGQRREPLTFTVEGTGKFPYDMLRYDRCWPLTEAHDSTALDCNYDSERRKVVLLSYSPNAPTTGRWESRGWKVLGEGNRRDEPWAEGWQT